MDCLTKQWHRTAVIVQVYATPRASGFGLSSALIMDYVTGRDALEGAGVPPPPSRAPSLCPATVSLTPSASLNGICNRQ